MKTLQKLFERSVFVHWLLPLLVFALALGPRLASLTTFLTYDEYDQLHFAAQFLQAILRRDVGGALVLGYPGVPTMALGALGLWTQHQLSVWSWGNGWGVIMPPISPVAPLPATGTYAHQVFLPLIASQKPPFSDMMAILNTVTQHPLAYIGAVRLPLIVVAGLMVTVIFLLLRRLVSLPMALAATFAINFNPLFLTLSNIIHVDAPLSYFMFASFLAFVLYLKEGGRWMLTWSGVLGALAVLSKTPALILGPILVTTGLIYTLTPTQSLSRREHWRRFVGAMAGWSVVALVAFVAFWPAMWSRPMFAVEWVLQNIVQNSQQTRSGSGVFWGWFNSDRNPLYYTYAFPFRWTPLTTAGALASLGLTVTGFQQRRRAVDTFAVRVLPLALSLQAFVIIFIAAISAISRRSVRYTLPAMFAVDLLAILGLVWFLRLLAQKIPFFISRPDRFWRPVLALLLALQISLVLAHRPYYYAYFNPALGGYRTAPYLVNMGLGEGLDAAARYLNQEPDAAASTTASWFIRQFEPYYRGKSVEIFDVDDVVAADHTVFYITQIQLGFPTPELLDYFDDRLPEKVITLGGVDYVWIYPGPIIGSAPPAELTTPLNAPLNERVTLLGLNVTQSPIAVTLYWQATAPLPPDLNVSIRAVDGAGAVWGQVDRLPIGGLVRTDKWLPGDIIRDEYMLPLDPAAPPGDYAFDILLYNFETGEIFGQARRVGSLTIALPAESPGPAALTIAHRADASVAKGLRLLGHTFEPLETLPGYRHTFKLYWRADPRPAADYALTLTARSASGDEIPLLSQPIGPATHPTGAWRRGEVLAEAVTFAFPLDAPPGAYTLLARAGDSAGVALGQVTLGEQAHAFTLPPDAQPGDARFGPANEIALAGYALAQEEDALALTLYWRANRTPADGLKVFVHLIAAGRGIIAQRDAVPAGGTRPTQTWLPGEIIADPYRIPLPPGRYTLWLGLYNPLDGQRLPVAASAPVSDNRVRLAVVEVKE